MNLRPDIQNKTLHDALASSITAVVSLLSPYVKRRRVPKEPIDEARFDDRGYLTIEHYHRGNYGLLLMETHWEWGPLPEVINGIQELLQDKGFQENLKTSGNGDANAYADQVLRGFLSNVLRRAKSWPPSKSLYEQVYLELEDYLSSTILTAQVVVPLENFASRINDLEIEPGIVIHRLSNPEIEVFVTNAMNGWSMDSASRAMRDGFALILDINWQKGTQQPDHHDSTQRILTILRLFKTGAVGANLAHFRQIKWQPGHPSGGSQRHTYTLPVHGITYALDSQECRDFKTFWSWMGRQSPNANAEVAIRWFNHGYQSWMPEDRLVSLVTAFESLFLKNNDAKGKKLGSRVPGLLTDHAGFARVKKNIDDIWKLRSNIVHAQPFQPTEPERLVDVTEMYVRASIKRYIELQSHLASSNHNDVLIWFDDPAIQSKKQAQFPQWAAL